MKTVRFGDLCKLQNGRAFKPEEWSEAGTPIVRIQNLNDENKPFNYCVFDVEKRFWIDSGDLLFSWSGTPGTSFGAFFWNRGKGFLNQHIFRVDVKEELVDRHYLRYALNSLILKIIDQAHGGVGLKHITKAKLEEVQIPLPPLAEQRRIASILDQADELRQKRQQGIEKLDQLLQVTFIDMFGDPVSNIKGWKVSSLGEQCKIGTGSTPSRLNSKNFEGTIPWVKSTDVDWGVITNTSETISQEGKESARLKTFPIGSIILALYGQGITRGKSALLGLEATLNQACAALVVKETIDNYFVFSFLKFSYKNLRSQARGGNQENLNLQIVKCFPIYLPPMELQEKWSKIALSIEDQKQKLYKQQAMQENLFKSLQNQAFSGTL